MQLGDAVRVRGQPQRQRRQAEAGLVAEPAEVEQSLAVEAGLLRQRPDVAVDELFVEHLVPGRHRGVRGEDRRGTHLLERVGRLHSLLDQRTCSLDLQERGMALVQMEHGRLDPERRERADAADPEQKLLPDPVLAVAAVERVGEPVDLEQVERDRADLLAPDGGLDRLSGELTETETGSRTTPTASGSTGW